MCHFGPLARQRPGRAYLHDALGMWDEVLVHVERDTVGVLRAVIEPLATVTTFLHHLRGRLAHHI